MELFDKITNKASKVYTGAVNKTTKIASSTKMKLKIAALNGEITDLYEEIGKQIYNIYCEKGEENISAEVLQDCFEIESLNNQISEYEFNIMELNNTVSCIKCCTEIKNEDNFCYSCGFPQKEELKDTCCNEEKSEEINEKNLDDNLQESILVQKIEDKIEKSEIEQLTNLQKTIAIESNIKEV